MLRTAFVIGALLVAMPSPPGSEAENAAAGPSAFAYAGAAVGAIADAKDFCLRQPAVCETAGHLARAAERKARYAARLIYEWAHESSAKTSQLPLAADLAHSAVTGAVTGAMAPAGLAGSAAPSRQRG